MNFFLKKMQNASHFAKKIICIFQKKLSLQAEVKLKRGHRTLIQYSM